MRIAWSHKYLRSTSKVRSGGINISKLFPNIFLPLLHILASLTYSCFSYIFLPLLHILASPTYSCLSYIFLPLLYVSGARQWLWLKICPAVNSKSCWNDSGKWWDFLWSCWHISWECFARPRCLCALGSKRIQGWDPFPLTSCQYGSILLQNLSQIGTYCLILTFNIYAGGHLELVNMQPLWINGFGVFAICAPFRTALM